MSAILNDIKEVGEDSIKDILYATGFNPLKDVDIRVDLETAAYNNSAYICRPILSTLIDKTLNLNSLVNNGTTDSDGKYTDERNFHILKMLVEELDNIPPGQKEQKTFHHLSARILSVLFRDRLEAPKIEKTINEGRRRIDIVCRTKNTPGVFKDLNEIHKCPCPFVFFECKNYSDEPKNPEYDQLSGRLSHRRGRFGILVCRKIEDRRESIQHCKDRLGKGDYIIVLDDEDIRKLSAARLVRYGVQYNLKEAGRLVGEIDEIIWEKLEEVIL